MIRILVIILGASYVLRGVLGVFLRFTYMHPFKIKINSVDLEEAFGTNTARGIFIFLGLMVLLLGFFVL